MVNMKEIMDLLSHLDLSKIFLHFLQSRSRYLWVELKLAWGTSQRT
jgi:hypothetical protein